MTETDTPGAIALPPLIFGAFLLLGALLDLLFPRAILPNGLQYVIGIPLIALSFAIALPAMKSFSRAGTAFDVRKPATALVTSGIMRYSRNPGYLGLALLYAGIAIVIDSLWIAVLLIPALRIMHHGVILREERYLERVFGEEYLRYKEKVRRWI